jgi:glycosyltransferase involved in cell wall biosynthesis
VYTLNGEFEREYEAKVKARVLELGMSYQDTDGSIHQPEIEKSSNSDVHLHLSSSSHFIFTGPLNDDAKWDAYDRADLFVLPTYSENFGIVVAEALWARVPVITTKGTPWSELEEYKCGKWIDLPAEGSNPSTWEALDEALVSVMEISDAERGEMGKRGRKLVEEKYTWEAVCGAMVKGYKEVSK